jgi:mannose-6-phosphate isomerase
MLKRGLLYPLKLTIMQNVFRLKGVIQNYAWGGKTYIADLLDISPEQDKPYAEYWMGTHQKGPSVVEADGRWLPLPELIAQDRARMLGKYCMEHFQGKLPYLFKVLDVEKMLSIQVHPSKAAAEIGYYDEEKRGIPIKAFDRNFKDDNHKPELMWAMTDFWLLHGFRNPENIREILWQVPEFISLRTIFETTASIEGLYQHVMEMPQSHVNEILEPLKERLDDQSKKGLLKKANPDFWAHRAFLDFTTDNNYDRGIFSVYLLNLVFVKPGEVVFQDAGILHAYLEGVNMELMANSDNVLRGGLTPKYVDVEELMKHVKFEPVEPRILKPVRENGVRSRVITPAPDFQLSHLKFKAGQKYNRPVNSGPEIYFVTAGKISVEGGFVFRKGEAFFVPDAASVHMEGQGELFCAGVPGE